MHDKVIEYGSYTGNPLIAATLGEHFGRYNIGVAFIEGLFVYTNCSFGTWVPGRGHYIQGWPLRGFHCIRVGHSTRMFIFEVMSQLTLVTK